MSPNRFRLWCIEHDLHMNGPGDLAWHSPAKFYIWNANDSRMLIMPSDPRFLRRTLDPHEAVMISTNPQEILNTYRLLNPA